MFFLDRRSFLKQSAGLAALIGGGAIAGAWWYRKRRSPPQETGERLNIAVIGVRNEGMVHVRALAGRHNCVVTTICDVDSAVVGPAVEAVTRAQGTEPRVVRDLRQVLDDPTIHAVTIATPNHWHALAAIWAMQAGKHVYVEKPVSHNLWEGRRMVEAARHYNKICQTGTQIRSQPGIRAAMEYLHAGNLGPVQVARGLCYKRRNSIGQVNAPQTPPASMDYDRWCGPAAHQPPRRRTNNGSVHYDWHWTWEYGNGDLGNQGIHQLDVARWGLGVNTLPRAAVSFGGRLGYTDDGETPNTLLCHFDYGAAHLLFEVRGLQTDNYRGAMVGNVFHCREGYLVVTSYTNAIAFDNDNRVLRRFDGEADHFGNFVRAVRAGRRDVLHADILEGHLSSALAHLGNISYRLGRPVPFVGRSDALAGGHPDVDETLARTVEHLRANGIALDQMQLRDGRRLVVDAEAENFGSDNEANRLVTREYRAGYEVPARF